MLLTILSLRHWNEESICSSIADQCDVANVEVCMCVWLGLEFRALGTKKKKGVQLRL